MGRRRRLVNELLRTDAEDGEMKNVLRAAHRRVGVSGQMTHTTERPEGGCASHAFGCTPGLLA